MLEKHVWHKFIPSALQNELEVTVDISDLLEDGESRIAEFDYFLRIG